MRVLDQVTEKNKNMTRKFAIEGIYFSILTISFITLLERGLSSQHAHNTVQMTRNSETHFQLSQLFGLVAQLEKIT